VVRLLCTRRPMNLDWENYRGRHFRPTRDRDINIVKKRDKLNHNIQKGFHTPTKFARWRNHTETAAPTSGREDLPSIQKLGVRQKVSGRKGRSLLCGVKQRGTGSLPRDDHDGAGERPESTQYHSGSGWRRGKREQSLRIRRPWRNTGEGVFTNPL